jgi:hypothetical protein
MYFIIVLLLLGILPAGSVFYEHAVLHSAAPLTFLIGKWFTFWAAGVRLFLAGLRQTFLPHITARDIFKLDNAEVFPLVREIGFGNLATGALALLSLAFPAWIVPAALVGGLYYLLAGIGHTRVAHRNTAENFAMLTDFAIAVLLLGYVALRFMANSFAGSLPNQ